MSRGDSEFVYANSNGFLGGYRASRHHIDVSVIGEDEAGLQRDYWYTAARVASELQPAADVGRIEVGPAGEQRPVAGRQQARGFGHRPGSLETGHRGASLRQRRASVVAGTI